MSENNSQCFWAGMHLFLGWHASGILGMPWRSEAMPEAVPAIVSMFFDF